MSTDSRSTVHAIWESFVPSAFFLTIYLIIMLILVGPFPFLWFQNTLLEINNRVSDSNVRQALVDLELLKLIPFIVIFLIALALYLFDKIALGIGHGVPPHPVWHGSPLAYLHEYSTLSLWQMLDYPEQVTVLDREIERLVNLARAEQKEFLLGSLSYSESRFSFAMNLFAYSKAALFWLAFCAVWALVIGRPLTGLLPSFAMIWLFVTMICVLSLVLATHYLIENTHRKLWIAEGMLQLQGKIYQLGGEFDMNAYKAFQSTITDQKSMRFIGLRWGSLDELRRVIHFFIPQAQQEAQEKVRTAAKRHSRD